MTSAASIPIHSDESPGSVYDFESFAKQFASVPVMNRGEERALFKKVKRGKIAARDEFLLRNYRLVLWAINKWFRFSPIPQEDLFTAGVEGLLRALQTFDPDKGRFSTYATPWITQRIRKMIDDESRLIRIPILSGYVLKKIIGLPEGACSTENQMMKATGASESRIALALQGFRLNNLVRLDELRGEDGDFQMDPPDPVALNEFDSAEKGTDLENALSLLPPLARRILEKRFGMNGDGKEMRIQDLADFYKTDYQKIRRVIAKSIRILKTRAPHLQSLLPA